MKNSKRITIIIVAIFLLVAGLSYTYSRFTSSIEDESVIATALFLNTSNLSETLSVSLDDMTPGMTKSYTFAVKNFDETRRNEVALTYDIKVIKSDNIPVSVTLYKNGVEENILNSELTSLNNEMGFIVNQTDTYVLNIVWDITDNGYEYSDLVDYLDVDINSKQKIE